ncbi:MAG TPA: tetratricopeptide repeat protein [Opitutaceae bacterium]|nr:tetratricopeptide repeat protein [Opitutaceae bacterium]
MDSSSSREIVRRWLAALGCFAIVLFFFSPSWAAFSLWARVPEMSGMLEVRRGASVLTQVAHPGAEIADPLHQAIQWRLLFPLIGHVLGLSPLLFFSLADVGCVLVLAYVVTLLRRAKYGWWETILASVAIGASSWLFVSTGWLGYFDSWLALALLLVAFAVQPWPGWAACVWAPWVDERFVLAVPIALLCRWIRTSTGPTPGDFRWRRELGIPALLLGAFVFVRLGLLSGRSASHATLVGYFAGKDYLNASAGRLLLGVWEGLRAGWVFVVAAVFLLRKTPGRAAIVGTAVVVMIGAGLATAQDYSRSMTMVLPVAVTGLLLLARETVGIWRPRLLGVTAAGALLLPAHHVMQDWVNPIYYFYHELAAFSSPPPAAWPQLRELHAIDAMQQGDFATAEADLTLAMKLDPGDVSAAKRRGMLYASTRRWAEAKRDFTTVVQNDPKNPDGWFLRAQVELAMTEPAAAQADFNQASALAPAEWMTRPDVKRFLVLLQRESGQP